MNNKTILKNIVILILLTILVFEYFPKIKEITLNKEKNSTQINVINNQEIPIINNQIFYDENKLFFMYQVYNENCKGYCFRIKIYNDGYIILYSNETKKDIDTNISIEEIKSIETELMKNNILNPEYDSNKFCSSNNGGYVIYFNNGNNSRTISNIDCNQKHLPTIVENKIIDIFEKNNLKI
ncbi:MAG: hypothetical protein PHT94_04510 [Candidatus Nanoarchaeia archaeon]|nr:hypothetical protein [Candidatus Nanoarchaeia archaeon]